MNLESELKKLEISLDDANNFGKYNSIKNELDAIYDHIAERIRIRTKCDWYEYGEKQFFFKFRKTTKRAKYNKKTHY